MANVYTWCFRECYPTELSALKEYSLSTQFNMVATSHRLRVWNVPSVTLIKFKFKYVSKGHYIG
jgi:hypothetical protein